MITLTGGQMNAVAAAKQLAHESRSRGVLAGYAGTGKTTTIRTIADELDSTPMIITPTGRAALRVSQATQLAARTIHSTIYMPMLDRHGAVSFVLRTKDDYKDLDTDSLELIIVDEASMVGSKLAADIEKTADILNCSVLYVGDSFQLPPVQDRGEAPFSIFKCGLKTVELTEVLRQVADSPIIAAATLIRDGRANQAVRRLPEIKLRDLVDRACATYEAGGMIICHTNKTRKTLNRAMRWAYALGDDPLVEGEPLRVTRNNSQLNRCNGEIVSFDQWTRDGIAWEVTDRDRNAHIVHFATALVNGQEVVLCIEELFDQAPCASHTLSVASAKCCAHHKIFLDDSAGPDAIVVPHLNASVGYAMTCHSSQGSEWGETIIVVEPSVRFDEEEGQRWLYTAVTRAQETTNVCMLNRGGIQPTTKTHKRPAVTTAAQRALVVGPEADVAAQLIASSSGGEVHAVVDSTLEARLKVQPKLAAQMALKYDALIVTGPATTLPALQVAFKTAKKQVMHYIDDELRPL